jgi:hypothetical protein
MVMLTISGLLACSTVKADPKFRAVPGDNESVIAGVKIKYARDDRGCVQTCQFENDPARCGQEAECCKKVAEYGSSSDVEKCIRTVREEKADYIECIETPIPKIGNETIKSAGNTIESTQVCDDFRIVAHGSPGWTWTCTGGSCTLTCLGYYYAPLQLCCDPTGCVRKP